MFDVRNDTPLTAGILRRSGLILEHLLFIMIAQRYHRVDLLLDCTVYVDNRDNRIIFALPYVPTLSLIRDHSVD